MTQTTRLEPGMYPVPATAVQPHPDNPRRGDEGHIADLIAQNGWHGVVVVQAMTGRIVAGNHRYRAALQVYEKEGAVPGLHVEGSDLMIPAHVLDLDDDEALRILLGDNRASDLATYDEPMLLRLVSMVGDADSAVAVLTDPTSSTEQRNEALKALRASEYGGTGYTSEDVAQIAMGLLPETTSDKTFRTPEDMADQYENTTVRQIMLIMGVGEYETALVALRKVRDDNGLEDNTEALFWLLQQAGLVEKSAMGGWKVAE